MDFERKIISEFKLWKENLKNKRKALVIKGLRQIGKTYIVIVNKLFVKLLIILQEHLLVRLLLKIVQQDIQEIKHVIVMKMENGEILIQQLVK